MNDAERIAAALPGAVAALLGHGVPGDQIRGLLTSPRFAPRASAIAMRHLGELPRLEDRQVAALALDRAGLNALALGAGAVWHAATLARVVETAARRRLIAAFGADVYASALEARHLSPEANLIDTMDESDLAEMALHDGACCLTAWRDLQPPAVSRRLAVLLDRDSPHRGHATFGPAIVDWLLGRR